MSLTVAISPSSFADIDDTPIRILTDAGINIIPNSYKRRLTEAEIIDHLKGVNGLIAGLEPLNQKVLDSTTDLKAIARVGIGMDNIDLEYAKKKNIRVSNTPDQPTKAVAETTVSAMLCLCHNLHEMNADLHEKKWNKKIGISLDGAKVLIIGYGRIGREVRRLLDQLGAKVSVFDPYLTDKGITCAVDDLAQGLKNADIVSLHASGNDKILGVEEFEMMKNGTILLNCARGGLIDHDSLVENLQNGKIASVWIDTFDVEPYNGILTEFRNVLLTPHISTYTKNCRLEMEKQAVINLLKDLNIDYRG